MIFPQLYGQEVSTEVQKKNVLLEEFTGINCGNCPDGHAIAHTLQRSHPDQIYVVAIHAGAYASGEPDLKTDSGEELDIFFKANEYGYPGGMINRRLFENEPLAVMSRAYWTKSAKQVCSEEAPVNLQQKATYDESNRTLSVEIEGYWTQQIEQDIIPKLSVLWTQDNIIGFQNGSGQGNEYNHKHVLRGFLTPTLGEEIEDKTKGHYFSKKYNFTLPEAIKGVAVKAEHINIISFVAAGNQEILNVTGGKPTYKNLNRPLAANLYNPKIPVGSRYGYNYFELYLENLSNETLTEASFQIKINEDTFTGVWEGNIPPFSEKEIRLDIPKYQFASQNEYTIQLQTLNNEKVNPVSLSGEFANPIEATTHITITLKTDAHLDENSFLIKDSNGKVVKEVIPHSPAEYKEAYTLEKGEIYCFEIADEWGDGIQQGFLKIHSDSKKLLAQEYNISNFGYRSFFNVSSESSVDNLKEMPLFVYCSTTKTLHISHHSAADMQFTLYTPGGQKIAIQREDANQLQLPSVQAGIYLLQWQLGNQNGVMKLNVE